MKTLSVDFPLQFGNLKFSLCEYSFDYILFGICRKGFFEIVFVCDNSFWNVGVYLVELEDLV